MSAKRIRLASQLVRTVPDRRRGLARIHAGALSRLPEIFRQLTLPTEPICPSRIMRAKWGTLTVRNADSSTLMERGQQTHFVRNFIMLRACLLPIAHPSINNRRPHEQGSARGRVCARDDGTAVGFGTWIWSCAGCGARGPGGGRDRGEDRAAACRAAPHRRADGALAPRGGRAARRDRASSARPKAGCTRCAIG